MNHELRNLLNKIGWQTVQSRAPAYAMHLEVELRDPSRDRFTKSAKEATRKELARVAKLRAAIVNLRDALADLSDASLASIDIWACPSEHRDKAIPETSRLAVESVLAIEPHVAALQHELEHLTERAGETPTHNEAAYRVARVLAEIYVIGRGERPKKGSNDGKASSEFGLICHEAFRLLGVKSSVHSLEPIYEAIDWIDHERFERLSAIRRGASRNQIPSLFDVVSKGKLDRRL